MKSPLVVCVSDLQHGVCEDDHGGPPGLQVLAKVGPLGASYGLTALTSHSSSNKTHFKKKLSPLNIPDAKSC